MGGKDSIIVEPDCDLDAALEGVVASAFGFNGQKCSACSRAIVDGRHLRRLLRPPAGARRQASNTATPQRTSTPARSSARPPTARSSNYIEIGKNEGRLLTGGHAVETPEGGFYIAPTVIADVAPTARIALEEIFGPVLAVIKSHSFDEALAIANNTEYGLTGALYTSSREKLDRAREEFHVGNLYFNRKCTGAMVGAHPFGGFNMSGTDSKAGGPDYLLLFTQAKIHRRKDRLRQPLSGEAVRTDGHAKSTVQAVFIWTDPPPSPQPQPDRWWIVNSASSSRSDTPVLS